MARLGELCIIQSGGTPSRHNKAYWENGRIPWVKISDIKDKYLDTTEECITELGLEKSSAKIFPAGTILYTIFATLGEVCVLNIDAATNQAIAGIQLESSQVEKDYLYHYLLSLKSTVNNIGRGVAQNNINMTILRKFEISLPSLDEQHKIVMVLDKVNDLINKRRQQLDKLDELVKSRFVEMFGDPVTNSLELEMLPMTSVCEIIDGDRGENYPKAEDFSEEGYCLFLNAKNVTASGFNFDTCMYITKEKDESLRKGKLKRGDVVLTTRGTLGNLSYYTDKIPYDNIRINSGMVILRMKQEVIDEIYFIEQFKFQLDDIKSKIASGSAQPQLPISTMNKIQILIPEIRKQKEFASFVHQIDKSKSAIQKSLKKLETLKKSLMQEYFG